MEKREQLCSADGNVNGPNHYSTEVIITEKNNKLLES